MKEMYVIAYYGDRYEKVYGHQGWKDQYIGEGIVYESKPLTSYPMSPAERYVKALEPKDKEFKYAKIEKRLYPINW